MTSNLLIILTNSQGTLGVQSVNPEAINRAGILAVSEQEPEAKDWLGKDVQDGISNDLSINRPPTGTISNTPDDWVQGPDDEGEATNGSEQLGGTTVLGLDRTTTWHDELVDDDQEGGTGHGIVCPLLTLSSAKGGEETKEDHEQVGSDDDNDVSTAHASEEGKIKEEERSGQGPVNVASPEDLAVDVLDGVGDVLVGLLDDDVGEGVSVTGGHGEVGDGSKGGDEGSDDMEEAFLDWGAVGQEEEGQGRQQHDDPDDPESLGAGLTHLLVGWGIGSDRGDGRDGGGRAVGGHQQAGGVLCKSLDDLSRVNHGCGDGGGGGGSSSSSVSSMKTSMLRD